MKSLHFCTAECFVLWCLLNSTFGSIKVPGNVTVIGLFQIHEPSNGKCGSDVNIDSVMTAEAIKWYFKQLNNHGKLPFNIGFEAMETCRLGHLAAEITNSILYRVMNNETIVAGVLGPEFSSEAEVVSQILSSVQLEKRLVQVGFSTTAASLTDTEKYPNFIRIIPNDDIQVEMMIQTMKHLEWNRVALIYEDDTYGQDAASRLVQRAEQEAICIPLTKTINVDNGISIIEISDILTKVILGEASRPTISAVVIFASSTTVKLIFRWLSNSGLSSVPIFMISEAMVMDRKVFQSVTGEVISKAKGSLVLSPPYREVAEFRNHWMSIFTNATAFHHESISNPWLQDVFQSLTNCETEACDFSPISDQKYQTEFQTQHMYVQYAILAAHALTKGLQIVRQRNQNKVTVDVLKGMTVDISSDFQWRPESISDVMLAVSLSGEPQRQAGDAEYQLYNFRDTWNLSGFHFAKVGELSEGQTNISFNDLRDYADDGETEIEWPNTRKGQCLVGQVCAECLKMNQLYENNIFIPGDIYVVGIVPIFDIGDENGCGNIRTVGGYQVAESIRFAIDNINAKTGSFAELFPETKIGVIILNSCNNPVVIQRKIYELHTSGIVLSDGTNLNVKDKIVGYVGELVSDVSMAVAETLSRLKFIQISYASTLPALGDKSRFPYFMRVVTPADSQGNAIIKIVKNLNANYIQIVYSSTAYGEAGRDAVWAAAKQNNVCAIHNIAVGEDSNPMKVYNDLRRYPQARIVVIFLQSHKVLPVMSALGSQMNKGEFMFIGSQTWHHRVDILDEDVKQVLLGSYSLSFELYQDQTLRTHIQKLFISNYQQDPWSLPFLQEKYNCYYDLSFDKKQTHRCLKQGTDPNFALDYMDTYAYIATISLLTGVHSFLLSKCSTQKQLCRDFVTNPKGLMENIKLTRLDLDGSGNMKRVFNGNGDGNIGYRIYNIQKDTIDLNKLKYVEVGKSPLDGTFLFEKKKTVSPTEFGIKSTCPNEQACDECIEKPSNTSNTEERSTDVTTIVLGSLFGTVLLLVCVLIFIVLKLCRNIKALRQDDFDPIYDPLMMDTMDMIEMSMMFP